jgi:hypothetical protein
MCQRDFRISTLFADLANVLSTTFLFRLATIPQCAGLMSALLHPSQPPWLLHRSCRLLTLLSTCELSLHDALSS